MFGFGITEIVVLSVIGFVMIIVSGMAIYCIIHDYNHPQ